MDNPQILVTLGTIHQTLDKTKNTTQEMMINTDPTKNKWKNPGVREE
jgi:hypothetical protein